MNFKISFKTWLKFARKRIKQEEREKERAANPDLKDASASLHDNEGQPRMIPVDIEVEHIYSCTSEEESQADRVSNTLTSFTKKKSAAGAASILQGSAGDLEQSMSVGKKKRDHLKLFEKKMSQKLKS